MYACLCTCMCHPHDSHMTVALLFTQDSWTSVENIINFYTINQDEFQPAAGPGHWNDPDQVCEMLYI